MSSESLLKARAEKYAKLRGLRIDFDNSFGYGTDGSVWPADDISSATTLDKTAVKVFERQRNYSTELQCYQRLAAYQITEIGEFSVPGLVDYSDGLLVIRMTIVTPPTCWISEKPISISRRNTLQKY